MPELGHHVSNVVPQPSAASQILVAIGAHVIFGWSFTEPNVEGAKIILRDGTTGAGKYIAAITLNQNESVRDYFVGAIALESGAIYLEVVSGHIEGAVYWE
jgi:hypothetical protein